MAGVLRSLVTGMADFFSPHGKQPSVDDLFASFHDRHPVLVVFADDPSAQIAELDAQAAAACGLVVLTSDRRRLILLRFTADGQPKAQMVGGQRAMIALVHRLSPPADEDPHVILLARDGQVLRRWDQVVSAEALLAALPPGMTGERS